MQRGGWSRLMFPEEGVERRGILGALGWVASIRDLRVCYITMRVCVSRY